MKKIEPKKLIQLTYVELSGLATITGKPIYAQDLPFLGRTVCYGGKRECERVTDMPEDEYFATEIQQNSETKEVKFIYIGSKKHGPVMQITVESEGCRYYNLYSKGNFGNNFVSGGNWNGQSKRGGFESWQSAIENRHNPEYLFGDKTLEQIEFVESHTFINKLNQFLSINA